MKNPPADQLMTAARKRRRCALALALLISCVGCDQTTKHMARQTLRGRATQSYLADTVRLEYALNPGGFLSLGSRLDPPLRFALFIVLNVALLAGGVYLLAARWDMLLVNFLAIVLFLAGGVGNLIDRMWQNGMVTDFLNLGIGPLRTGIFNVADMALTTAVLTIIVAGRIKPLAPTPE